MTHDHPSHLPDSNQVWDEYQRMMDPPLPNGLAGIRPDVAAAIKNQAARDYPTLRWFPGDAGPVLDFSHELGAQRVADETRVLRGSVGQHSDRVRDQLRGEHADPAPLRVHDTDVGQERTDRTALHPDLVGSLLRGEALVQRPEVREQRSDQAVGLPATVAEREALPMYDYMFGYFPDAFLAEVQVAWEGNKQHNPGQKMHWARGKSTDHMNKAWRHQWDHARGITRDTDGTWHLAKAIWRLKAALQEAIEKEKTHHGPK